MLYFFKNKPLIKLIYKGDKIMLKKEYFAKMLICFGIGSLIAWIASFVALIMPFDFKTVKWVYLFSQQISEKAILPLFSIIAIIGGIYLCQSEQKESKNSKCIYAIWTERFLAVLSLSFFVGLVSLSIIFSTSIKPIYSEVKTQINEEANRVKAQISIMTQTNPNIVQENLKKGLEELNQKVNQELKKAKKDITVNSVKILISLIVFALIYLKFAIYLMKISLQKDVCQNTES